MESSFIDPGSVRWLQALARVPHDFYHLPDYVAFAAEHQEPGEPAAFLAQHGDDLMLIPLVLRQIPVAHDRRPTLRDASSPRGYAGPILSQPGTASGSAFAARAIRAFLDALREAGVVSAFLRLHPLLGPSIHVAGSAGTVVRHGESVSIDLAASDDEWWRQVRQDHRRGIRNARGRGFEVAMDGEWSAFDAWVETYEASMTRVGAQPFWRLPRSYFMGLRAALGERLHLCVVRDAGVVAAAALITEVDGIVEYHLAGTADSHVSSSPSKLIVDFVRSWARARGNRVFHLGGSLRSGDSLSQFKANFSPLRHPVESWRLVSDEAAYRALTRQRAVDHGTPPADNDQFFPAYRRPPPDTPV